jgi:hypothetical protein
MPSNVGLNMTQPTFNEGVCVACYAHWRIGDALWFQTWHGEWICPECFKETAGKAWDVRQNGS